ncbi:CRISPR-associated helicase Cas3' [Sporolactobacillus shoreicorticis]|uniref:CRISPR-associated helicase Cas3 n=1 Tax=Sporolactobacillus shoreicorticis TaxID=1923877 RepID=A0ABW5S7H3_9BACL|nr:CRISPR-associated helicase Cas3' [Sporolactobacillus shoreicorticis]MCO7126961.1 CRISPR-associated helicase Cas3' [Sporolactobacillus shoreicorticis]
MSSYIAHYRENDHKPQTVREHLLAVKNLAEDYGKEVGVRHISGLAGLLHDLGKYSNEFQDYLYRVVFTPENAPKRGSVDHATAGGKHLFELLHSDQHREPFEYILSEIVSNAIVSHHSYLHDYFSPDAETPFYKRITKGENELPEYESAVYRFHSEVISTDKLMNYIDVAVKELKTFFQLNSGNPIEKAILLTQFVYSCLIDADRTDTRLFEENHQLPQVEVTTLFEHYDQRLKDKLHSFKLSEEARTSINQLRSEMSEQCETFAQKPSGIYTLSIPTGGGKTLASMRYALAHALRYNRKQIIYIVPYTTIIEQNAKVIRSILKDDANILEHHSNVMESTEEIQDADEGEMTVQERLRLAKDNWDCPIILTTMVQFLNTFYKYGSRNIRRLHHLTNSVIIFDEIQKVPIHCISLFNQAVNFLKTFGQSSILLCTATQPALNYVRHALDINPHPELIQNLDHVFDAFIRVKIIDRSYQESFNTEKLADFIDEQLDRVNNILVILNTKSVVRKLYQCMKQPDRPVTIFHLSTAMCAKHREVMLEQVKDCLKRKVKMVCISTQLIEAGVDVSFECVIRSLAGLDSIAQAAGRCNRNGEYPGHRKVFIIDHEEEKLANLFEISRGKSISKMILKEFHENSNRFQNDILSHAAMDWYFKNYFNELEGKLDFNMRHYKGTLVSLLNSDRRHSEYVKSYKEKNGFVPPLFLPSSLKTAAKEFYVINETTSVIVPYGDGKEIIADLNSASTIEDFSQLFKNAQHFSINIYDQDKRKLEKENLLIPFLEKQVLVLREAAYSDEFGLDLGGDGDVGAYVF